MEKIRSLLTSGEFMAGDKIPTEQELADRFGIGRSSIREAIKIFQHLGILESKVPKGTFLCDKSHVSTEAISWSIFLGAPDMWEILYLRQLLEETAFRSMLTRCLDDHVGFDALIKDLEHEIEIMKEAAKENSIDKLTQADYSFHAIIFREGRINLFQDIYKILHSFMTEEIKETYKAMKDLFEVSQDHKEIIDTIKTRNPEKAVARHHAHFPRIQQLLATAPVPKFV
jgi:DNA-binding FadR family transcriptional regulator